METATRRTLNEITEPEGGGDDLWSKPVFVVLAALFVLNLLLRVFYLRYDFVNGDEAIRALTATSVLDGARLYVDIVTDKPPATTIWYAAVFAIFGRHMVAIHLAAAMWNFFTAVLLYALAGRHYGKRTGLWAAALFVYFSTNYLTHDMMAANTELLMAPLYVASFAFYLHAVSRRRAPLASITAGLLTGIAVLFKQLGAFNLLAFALCELFLLYRQRNEKSFSVAWRQSRQRLTLMLAGVALVFAALVGWLSSLGALGDFWRSVFVMNTFYISSLSTASWFKFFIGRMLSYMLFNVALWALAIGAAWRAVASYRRRRPGEQEAGARNAPAQDGDTRLPALDADLLVLIWASASLAAVLGGGRFFGHYFIQVLPVLCLLAARGVTALHEALRDSAQRRRARVCLIVLLAFFLGGLVRFHQRTAILAYEVATGEKTQASANWGMDQRQEEAQIIARKLQGRIDKGEALYIWDYALDVYWRTQTRPAARFLTPNHVTGIFTDAEAREPNAGEAAFWAESRRQLIEDLRRQRPRLILDVSGGLPGQPYADLVDFVQTNYRREDELGILPARPFVVYRLRGE